MDLYQILSLVISAFAAIGTIAATFVALYLANRQDKVYLKVAVYKAVMIGSVKPWPKFVAISIINRSKFPIQVDSIGWSLPKSSMGRCYMFEPGNLYSNGSRGSSFPFSVKPGEKSPLFTIPWQDFETTLQYMATNDADDVFFNEVIKKKVFFYVSTPRADGNLDFKINKDIMDAFVDSLKYRNEAKRTF